MAKELIVLLNHPPFGALESIRGQSYCFQQTINGFAIFRLALSDVHVSSCIKGRHPPERRSSYGVNLRVML